MKHIALLLIAISLSATTLFAQSEKAKARQKNYKYELQDEIERYFGGNGYEDNKKARQFLKGEVFIENVRSGMVSNIHDMKKTTLLFITYWDPSSAMNIGHFKQRLDAGEQVKFAFVYFESEKQEILEMESDSWHIDYCFVLHGKSKSLKESIGKIPLIIGPKR